LKLYFYQMNAHEPDYALPVGIPGLKRCRSQAEFRLEAGGILHGIEIGYHTYGSLNAQKDNVVWVCHALTANSQVDDWWSGLFGKGNIFDPERDFIVCANTLGSCYGSTGARSINPATGEAYGVDFPLLTIRDQVRAHLLLMDHLGIEGIRLCMGGSCGGHQALEMAWLLGEKIRHLVLLVTSAKETAWAIAGHAAQRMAIKADPTFFENENDSGAEGMRAARAMALLNYRTFQSYVDRQTDHDEIMDGFRASSYVSYQGEKLARRFYPHCYYHLTRTLDTHDVGRKRGGVEKALSTLEQDALVIGIGSDVLIPPAEQKLLARHMPNAVYKELYSAYGHDGFLIETRQIREAVQGHLGHIG
jgi:homoserine O-acetyltransferase